MTNWFSWIDERRYKTTHHLQVYQKRVAMHLNNKIKSRNLKEGDLVLELVRKSIMDTKGKFGPNWTVPYVIKKLLSGEPVELTDIDGSELHTLTKFLV